MIHNNEKLRLVGNFFVSISVEGFEGANDGRRGQGHFKIALAYRRQGTVLH